MGALPFPELWMLHSALKNVLPYNCEWVKIHAILWNDILATVFQRNVTSGCSCKVGPPLSMVINWACGCASNMGHQDSWQLKGLWGSTMGEYRIAFVLGVLIFLVFLWIAFSAVFICCREQYFCVKCDISVFDFEKTRICLFDNAVISLGSVLVYTVRWSCLLVFPFFPLHHPGDFKYLNKLNLWSDGLFRIKCKNQCPMVYWGSKASSLLWHSPLWNQFIGTLKALESS